MKKEQKERMRNQFLSNKNLIIYQYHNYISNSFNDFKTFLDFKKYKANLWSCWINKFSVKILIRGYITKTTRYVLHQILIREEEREIEREKEREGGERERK